MDLYQVPGCFLVSQAKNIKQNLYQLGPAELCTQEMTMCKYGRSLDSLHL